MTVFVVLEALDGVGKTTLAKNLEKHFGYIFLRTPGESLQSVRARVISSLGDSEAAKALFYAATVQAEGEKAAEYLNSGKTVVMDRYAASTIAYAKARGVTVDLDAALKNAVQPDLELLIYLSEPERQRRLAARGATAEDLETLDEGFRTKVLAELTACCSESFDITGFSEYEAAEHVHKRIEAFAESKRQTHSALARAGLYKQQ